MTLLKIYHLSQNTNNDWDTYDSCVVCATSEADAKSIDPNGLEFKPSPSYGSWARSINDIVCVEIGKANKDQKRGVIIASFNAG